MTGDDLGLLGMTGKTSNDWDDLGLLRMTRD